MWHCIDWVAWILKLIRKCGIVLIGWLEYWNCSDSLVFYFYGSLNIRTVPTVCYIMSLVAWILELFRQCGIFFLWWLEYWNCSDSVTLYWLGGLNIGTIPTVWHIISWVAWILEQVRQYCILYLDRFLHTNLKSVGHNFVIYYLSINSSLKYLKIHM